VEYFKYTDSAMKKTNLILLTTIIFFFGCTVSKKTVEIGDTNNSRKVLIATENSEFKKEVVDRLIEKLGTQNYYFCVISLKQLEEVDSKQYGTVLLVCKVAAGKIQSRANNFIKKESANPKLVVFLTSGSEDMLSESIQTDLSGVDAITTASKISEVEKLSEKLKEMVLKRF
jgi:hypothetical protein